MKEDTAVSRLLSAVGWLLIATATGCATGHDALRVDCLADIPPGAVPVPAGNYNAQWQATQAMLADQDKFVIYGYEWASATEPTLFGREHLEGIAEAIDHVGMPVVIARSEDSALDEARKQAVIAFLAEQGHSSAADMVIIARPEALGLYGFEAPLAARGFIGGMGGRGGMMQGGFGGGMMGMGMGMGMGSGMGSGMGFGGGGFF